VDDSGAIVDLIVALDITHTYDAQLTATLIAPDGTPVELFSNVGADGDDFTNTVFDDAAATSITTGTAPFSGAFRPEGSLAAFNGLDAAGTWTLEIIDNAKGETGTLNSWSIEVATYEEAPVPGITVQPTTGLLTTEDQGTDTFTVVLDSKPSANVTIGISSSNTSEGTVDQASLTFTPTNWDTAQTVTITGVEDGGEVDGDVAYTIITAAATGAAEYVGIDPDDVAVTNLDNDSQAQPHVFYSMDTPLVIADAHPRKGARTTVSEIDATTHDLIQLLSFEITLDGSTDMSDVDPMVLTSPAATSVSITPVYGTTTLDLSGDFPGEDPYGIWTLAITDVARGNTHTLTGWSLTINDPAQSAAADLALLALSESDASEEEETDLPIQPASTDLALMMMEN
jgi:subtilisin-like proprotein convertase family protein